ncbi:MAG: hypothetical protein K8T26_11065 [Lentisphaerae bacterium]|nr:hypothetical protein [Lentisphaerota bacterium]
MSVGGLGATSKTTRRERIELERLILDWDSDDEAGLMDLLAVLDPDGEVPVQQLLREIRAAEAQWKVAEDGKEAEHGA